MAGRTCVNAGRAGGRVRARVGRLARRGGVYVVVMACAVILFVVGASAIALASVSSRTVVASRDWNTAGMQAQSAIEMVCAMLNANSSWRTQFTSGTPVTYPMDGSSLQVTLVDLGDGNLSDSTTDSVRVYAQVTLNQARRVYSAMLSPTGTAGLDLLRCPIHAAGTITTSSSTGSDTLTIDGGPLSTNSNLSNAITVQGNAEVAGSVTSSGYIAGFVTNPAAVKTMPADSTVTAAFNGATTISAPVLLSQATISGCLLSATSNPYGTPNASGLYRVAVPVAGKLTISNCRIKGSLYVTMVAVSSLEIGSGVVWEPASPTMPALVVSAPLGGTITIDPGTSALSEAAQNVNFNPTGTPYNGVSNTTKTDTYSPVLNGVYHVMGSLTTTVVGQSARLVGCLVCEGAVTITATPHFSADPTIIANPPIGYANTSGTMSIVPGTYQWEQVNNTARISTAPSDPTLLPTPQKLN